MARPTSYRRFAVRVRRRIVLSPALTRFVLHGDEVAAMTTHGPDQRVKLFFPLPGDDVPVLPDGDDWYARYRALPVAARPPMRTYTIRALRAPQREVDVDFVMHGDGGPASAWAGRAQVGDALTMLAPDAAFDGTPDGFEWRPPATARHVLLAADETALPAVAGILEALANQPSPPEVTALLEVPQPEDQLRLRRPSTASLVWLPRATPDGRHAHGERLVAALRDVMPTDGERVGDDGVPDPVDVDRDILWERADADAGGFHAWIACEAGAAMAMRRHLVGTLGIDRRRISCMGYWRQGRALD